MNFIPSIVIDKSTIQGLSSIEIEKLKRYIKIVVTPPLIRELCANLSDDKETEESLCKKVSKIAKDLIEARPIFQYSIESLVIANLLGHPVPMDGEPFLLGSQLEYTDNEVWVKEPEPSIFLRRLALMKFNSDDFNRAKQFKTYHQSVDLNKYKKNFNELFNPPKFTSLDECNKWIKAKLNTVDQKECLGHLIELTSCSLTDRKNILERWEKGGFQHLKDFSCSGILYLINFLLLCFGISSDLIPSSNKDKAFIDIEYFLYLPYANGISSEDKLFKKLFAIFSRDEQIFITCTEIKDKLLKIDHNEDDDFF